MGGDAHRAAEQWTRNGVGRVVLRDDAFSQAPDSSVGALLSVFAQENPHMVVAAHGGNAGELAYRLAKIMELPFVADVIGLTRYQGSLILLQESNWRTIHGHEDERPIATIRPGRFQIHEKDGYRPSLIGPTDEKELKTYQPV